MKNLLFFCTIAILFSSCGGSDSKNEFRNDFDQIADWGFNSPVLKKGDAHSGVYYCGLDSSNEYSITFQKAIQDLPKHDFKSIAISAWVRCKTAASRGAVVISIDSIGGTLKYMGVPLSDFITDSNKWTEIQGTFSAPEKLQSNNILKVYLYNAGKENIDIDDIKFELK